MLNNNEPFWNTLISLKGEDIKEDTTKLEQVIKYPKYLYRYRAVNYKSIVALAENKLYFSTANYYDDQFDTNIHIDIKRIKEEISQCFDNQEQLNQVFKIFSNKFNISNMTIPYEDNSLNTEYITKYIENYLKHIRVELKKSIYSICFSDIWNNETLWLKYADNHNGFAIEYDITNPNDILCGKEDICKNCSMNDIKFSVYPMYYSNNKYDATMYAHDYLLYNLYLEIFRNNINALEIQFPSHLWEKERISLIKKKCHEYDREWRCILNTNSIYNNGSPCLKWKPSRVILGLKVAENSNEEKFIIGALKKAGIHKLSKVVISNNDELELKDLF